MQPIIAGQPIFTISDLLLLFLALIVAPILVIAGAAYLFMKVRRRHAGKQAYSSVKIVTLVSVLSVGIVLLLVWQHQWRTRRDFVRESVRESAYISFPVYTTDGSADPGRIHRLGVGSYSFAGNEQRYVFTDYDLYGVQMTQYDLNVFDPTHKYDCGPTALRQPQIEEYIEGPVQDCTPIGTTAQGMTVYAHKQFGESDPDTDYYVTIGNTRIQLGFSTFDKAAALRYFESLRPSEPSSLPFRYD